MAVSAQVMQRQEHAAAPDKPRALPDSKRHREREMICQATVCEDAGILLRDVKGVPCTSTASCDLSTLIRSHVDAHALCGAPDRCL